MREVHVAGQWVLWDGRYLRQRCSWCGTLLIDVDMSMIQVAIPAGKTEDQARTDGDLDYPTWQIGALVAFDGAAPFVIAVPGDMVTVPDDCCMKLDPAVTC